MRKESSFGFTLIELLVVIGIIAIISGLLLPAVYTFRVRAKEAKIQQTCKQMVVAWETLQNKYTRFPSEDLIKDNTEDLIQVDGDLCFPMTPKAGCLLNWWTKQHDFPKYDKKRYNDYIKKLGSSFKWDDPTTWPTDTRFERSGIQKQFGVVAPWLEIKLKEEQASSNTKVDTDQMMWVLLDTNNDGKITPPIIKGMPTEKITDADGNQKVLYLSVAAWVVSDDGKVITSW